MGIFKRVTDHLDRQSTLMGGMMERLNVDFQAGDGVALGQRLGRAVRACVSCQNTETCQAWQDAHVDGAAEAPAFCPNADLWTSLKHG
jgi:hypothetical protein